MIFYKLKSTVWAPVCLIAFSSAFVYLENALIVIFRALLVKMLARFTYMHSIYMTRFTNLHVRDWLLWIILLNVGFSVQSVITQNMYFTNDPDSFIIHNIIHIELGGRVMGGAAGRGRLLHMPGWGFVVIGHVGNYPCSHWWSCWHLSWGVG